MKGYRIHELGGINGLRLDDLPSVKPGHGEVAVRVRAVSLNYRDLLVIKGAYSKNLPLPLIPTSDGAGEVIEVGPGVTEFKPGDHVAGCFFSNYTAGQPSEESGKTALGGAIDGMLAQERILPATGVIHVPPHLDLEEAATLPCAALTAWHALVESGGVRAGQSVLIQGTGGVSLFALQIARLMGARVIGTSSNDDKIARVRDLGADEAINYRKTPEWGNAVRNLSDKIGVDHIVEVGGAGTLAQSLKAIRVGGHIALIGVLSGAGEANPLPILMKNVRVQGIYVGSREMFASMNRAIGLSRLHPIIDRVFPFDQAREAYAHLESGAHFGKVVIRVD